MAGKKGADAGCHHILRRPCARGARDLPRVLGTDSPKNRQAGKPALRALGENQPFVETPEERIVPASRSNPPPTRAVTDVDGGMQM